MISRIFVFTNAIFSRFNVFDDGAFIGYDDVPVTTDPAMEMQSVIAVPRTGLGIGLGGGSVDVPVVWRGADGVALPFADTKYRVCVADTLGAGVSATVLAKTKTGCTVRITATILLVLGTPLYVTATGWA